MRWSTAALTVLATPAEGTDSGHALSPFRSRRRLQANPSSAAGLPALKKVTGGPGPDPILGECEADCDDDGDCQAGLRCFQRWENEEVPGCVGTGFKKEDFCYNQTAYPNHLLTSRDKDIKGKLGVCEGPCKGNDNNCESDLECFIRRKGDGRDGFAPVPGCLGVGKEGNDYCIEKSQDLAGLTGFYFGYDTEDASYQNLQILCNESHCDIILADPRFTTCEQVFGAKAFFTGVGIAKGIPINSLADFRIGLYCLEPGKREIDFEGEPTTTLTGNMLQLPDGGIRRTGPGFAYSKISVPQMKHVGGTLDINDESVNLNGRYEGIDVVDGSIQDLGITCTKKTCNIILQDRSFLACQDETNVLFFGIGYAKNVPRDSLDDFEIEIYCVPEGELIIDPSREPDDTIPINFELAQNGIIRRTDIEDTYFKIGPDETAGGFSVYEDFNSKYAGTDTEDGSFQLLEVDCQGGLCDVALQDRAFSTCVEATGQGYLGYYIQGLATAIDVPQDSLFDFELDLYCAPNNVQGIDFSAPAATLTGNLAFLQDGIVRRTGPGFNYVNISKKRKALNGDYRGGINPPLAGDQTMKILCGDDMCEVILWNWVVPGCIGPSGGRFFANGIAVNPAVPKESLGDFGIDLFCVPPGAGEYIDYENQTPLKTIKAKIVADDTNPGIASLAVDYPYPEEYKMFKWSDE